MRSILLLLFIFIIFSINAQTLNLTTSPQFVRLGDLDVSGNQITIEALVKKTATGGNILSKHTDPSNVNYLMRIGTFEITTTSGFTLMSNPFAGSMQNGVWYHIAGTYDGQFVRYYVNGCLIVQEARSGNIVQNNLITAIGNINASPNGEQYYGEIDELRIWSVARSAAELEANMFTLPNPTTTPNLVAYYNFDGNLTNLQGNTARNGTWVGTPSYGTQPANNVIQNFTLNSTQTTATSCYGSSDGQISINATGQGLQYSINNTTWQNSNVFTGLAANTYTVYVRNQEGCIISDATVVVTQPAQVIGTASNNGPFCTGGAIQLNGTSTFPSPSYSWTGPNGYTSTVQNPSDATEAGTYSLTVTSNGCNSPVSTTTVVINPLPNVTAANTGPYCAGTAISLNATTTSTGTPTFSWTGPNGYTSTVQNPSDATEAGTYNVTTTLNGCTSTASSTTVIIDALPMATASNTGPYCTGATITLNGTTNSTGTVNYAWTGPNGFTATSQNPTNATAAGTYQLTVTVGNCSSTTASTTVIINAPSTLTMSKTDVLCNGGTTGTATVATNTTGNNTYSWSPSGGNTATITGLATGTYTVTVTNSDNCTSTNSITINQPQPLLVTTNVTPSSCLTATGTATTTPTGGVAPYSYTWSPGNQNTNTITSLSPGTYTVQVSDANQCTQQATATITVASPPVVTVQNSQNPSCVGTNNGSITLSTINGTPAYTYTWLPNVSSTNSATGLAPGAYTIIVSDAMGCIDSLTFTLNQPTELSIEFDHIQPNCGGANGSISANPIGGNAPFNYNWTSHGLTTNPISNLVAGTYILQLTDANGCAVIDTFNLLPDNVLNLQTNPITATINEGASVNLNVTFSPYIAGSTYTWTPTQSLSCTNCPNPTANPITTTSYTITVITPDSCIASKEIEVKVIVKCGEILIPTVFSPNGDGQNDFFDIHGVCIVSRTMKIYNRWGEKIFSSDEFSLPWDGRFNGSDLNVGTYAYVFDVTLLDGTVESYSGSVSLIK